MLPTTWFDYDFHNAMVALVVVTVEDILIQGLLHLDQNHTTKPLLIKWSWLLYVK